MKWKDPTRVIDRIVERVVGRLAKGSAFRAPTALAGVISSDRERNHEKC
jgi:hypothetical protein